MAFKNIAPETAVNNQGELALENNCTTSYIINNDNVIPTMLTVKETAARFGIAQHYARQLALSGRVKAVRAGRKILINQSSVTDYFNNNYLTTSQSNDENSFFIPVKL
jgi:excisionase family DNA binding protein